MMPDKRPAKVMVYGFDNALSSAITGVVDLFAQAGVTWQAIHGEPRRPVFSVELVSARGTDIRCANGLTLKTDGPLDPAIRPDVLLIPSIGSQLEEVLTSEQRLYPILRQYHQQQVDIAANCTGVFLLAQAGILDGRQATTHWGFANAFAEAYPRVNLHSEKLHTMDENLFCAGGGMAWFDLALVLIERYAGTQVARQTAKAHVLDLPRFNQTLYAGSRRQQHHQDELIKTVQSYLADHLRQPVALPQLAAQFNLTTRTLIRRFKAATGQTPVQYTQQIRIDHARKLLETQRWTIERILSEIGYEDASSFSRLFKRQTGCSPSQYRSKFAPGDLL